jgi:hypothetical protein
MDLGELQRALRDTLRRPEEVPSTDDPELAAYLASVSGSGRAKILVHVIHAWRAYDVERSCPLTTAALRASGWWEQALTQFDVGQPVSPFIDRLAPQFLEALIDHSDSLVATVARFERAILAVRRGSEERFMVWWDREPTSALAQLLTGEAVAEAERSGSYLTIVASDQPMLFTVVSHAPTTLEASH